MLVRNGALLMQVNAPEKITAVLPQAKVLNFKGRQVVAVKHTLDVARVLNNLGLDAPSPVLTQYSFPGRYTPSPKQLKTVNFLTLNKRRAYCFNEMRCVDSESEYLSPTGWKKISEYDGGMVAQYNRDSKQASFVQPTEYIKKPCAENMIRFKNTAGVDQLLTAGHRVLYVSSTGTTQVDSAGSIMQKDSQAIKGWSGRFITTFAPPVQNGVAFTDAELRVMVAVIADSYFGNNTNYCVMRLKKEHKIVRMKMLLESAGIEYKERLDTSETGEGFTVITFYAPAKHKDYSQYWSASPQQLYVITDEVFHWDGSERKANASDFSTFVKESADFIQYACASCGRTASLNAYTRERRGRVETEYVVHAREKAALLYIKGATSDGKKITNMHYEPPTDGFAYCFAVPDTFWVMRRNGCIVITGNTGKTAAALWAVDYLMSLGEVYRVLVVSPLSVMEVWANEGFAVLPHRDIIQLVGDRDKKIKLVSVPAFAHVINFDGLRSLYHEEYYPNTRKVKSRSHAFDGMFDLIIVDEASAYCNKENWRWKALNRLIGPDTALWMLTGTPQPNAPTDTYGLIRLMHPSKVPSSFKLYEETLMYAAGPYKKLPRDGAKDVVYDYMQPAIRLKRDVNTDLPTTIQDRHCAMSPEQLRAFEAMKLKMLYEKDEVAITAANAAVKLIKLQQIMAGAVKDDDGSPYELKPSTRLKAVEELVKESDSKTVVFVPFKHSMHMVANYLNSKGITNCIVNGDVSKSARDKIFSEFKSGAGPTVLIAHPKVAAHGLDLTCASTFIWYAPTFSTEQYEQANARGEGPKKTFPIGIYHIGCHPLEWRIYEVLKNKSNMQSRLLDMYESIIH